MIDRIIDIDGDDSAVGIKNVTFNEPIFQGHFPGKPVFPGVLIIEGMAQTAGAIVIAHDGSGGRQEDRPDADDRQGEVPEARRTRATGSNTTSRRSTAGAPSAATRRAPWSTDS